MGGRERGGNGARGLMRGLGGVGMDGERGECDRGGWERLENNDAYLENNDSYS
jgi:hypothetical protein